jgi:alkylmercury lyase
MPDQSDAPQSVAACAEQLPPAIRELHRGVIDSADPDTGTPIRIHRHSDEWTWQPATAVVVIAQTDCSGTLADSL